MSVAFVFPGQGAQAVGMGRALWETSAAAREVFEEVDDTLHQNLSRLIFEGPEDELTRTENAQPALMTVSLAVVRALVHEAGLDLGAKGLFLAGHSLGEYSALAAGGALPLATAARLLRLRGRAMQEAVPLGEGGMTAVLGLDLPAVHEVAAAAAAETGDGAVCTPANDNAPGQVVVSGHAKALAHLGAHARKAGARKCVPLDVSAPFHCSLMAPAASVMEQALRAAPLLAPCLPVMANVSATPLSDPHAVRAALVDQVTGAVRWRESMEAMVAAGVTTVVELGAGKVLSGLAKRIRRDLTTHAVGGPEDVDALMKAL